MTADGGAVVPVQDGADTHPVVVAAGEARIAELERLLARRTAERNAARQELDRQMLAAGQVPHADGSALSARLHVVVDELRRLSEEMEERNSALAAAHWRLEQRVAERTAALHLALQAKQESEARFRSVAENVPQLVWVSCPEGRWEYSNRRWQAYTGQTQRASHDLGWLDAVHPGDRDLTMAAWRAASQAGTRFLVEHRLRGADGTWRWFETQAMPVRGGTPPGADGSADRPHHWVGSSTDIHARKLAEHAMQAANDVLERELAARRDELAESEARFRAYFQISSDALFVVACAPAGRFLHEALNQRFERLTGFWSEQAVGRTAPEFMPSATAAVFEEHYRRCAAKDAPHAFDALLALPSGDRMLRVSLVPALGSAADGQATRCLLGSARDISNVQLVRPPPDLDA